MKKTRLSVKYGKYSLKSSYEIVENEETRKRYSSLQLKKFSNYNHFYEDE